MLEDRLLLSEVSAAIDRHLLDLIDQYAPRYYREGEWQLSLAQYKAWIATIAWAEGARAGYGAHSRWGPGRDRFDHKAVGDAFYFSTGIGPFQLDWLAFDFGEGGWDWRYAPTIKKLDPKLAVKSVLSYHHGHFVAQGTTLGDMASAGFPWLAVDSPAEAALRWPEVTGQEWRTHSVGVAPLDWGVVKERLASNASDPKYRYESSVEDVGLMNWSIDDADGIYTDGQKAVLFEGMYPTWLITARNENNGNAIFQYYYTQDPSTQVEVWVLNNPEDQDNAFRYAFVRDYSTGPWPAHRFAGGEILASPAISLGGTTPPERFRYSNFDSAASLNLLGSAAPLEGRLRLTPAAPDSRGAAWYSTKQRVGAFVTTFQFQITSLGGIRDSDGNAGADGLAFVIQNDSALSLPPGPGGNIGYELPNSIAIEFDTFNNSVYSGNGDPNGNHVSIQTGGTLTNSWDHRYSLGSSTTVPNLSDGSAHTVVISYFSGQHDSYPFGSMDVFIDDMSSPVLHVNVLLADLLNLDNGRAWVGFTAATGAAWENHDILSWAFSATDVLVADLSMDEPGLAAPASAATGETIEVEYAVRNTRGLAPPIWVDRLFLSEDQQLDDRDRLLATVQGAEIGPLLERDAYRGSITTEIPPDLTPGAYYLIYMADSGNALPELDEEDNLAVLPISITSAARFQVGDYVRVTANVRARVEPGLDSPEIENEHYSPKYLLNPGTVGLVCPDPEHSDFANPTIADGYTWWHVAWGKGDDDDGWFHGWSVESSGGVVRLENALSTNRAFGVDASAHQHRPPEETDRLGTEKPIDWHEVADSGHQFAFVKATEKTNFINPWLAADAEGAKEAKLLVGVYHVARPDWNPALTGERSAEAEAKYFVAQSRSFLTNGYLQPALDLEPESVRAAVEAGVDLYNWVDTWIQTVRKEMAGYNLAPLVYTNVATAKRYFNKDWGKRRFWFAEWHPLSSPPAIPEWATWDFWQYNGDTGGVENDEAIVPGIPAKVDVNVFNGDVSRLRSEFLITERQRTAWDDAFVTEEDTLLRVPAPGVFSNDSYVGPITAELVTGPSHGYLAFNRDSGHFSYRPFADYHGTDSFTYKIYDVVEWSNVATVTITINPVNDAPVARDDAYTMDQNAQGDASLTVAAPGLLANDSDVDGDGLAVVWTSDPAHGTLALNADGSFTYVPTAGYSGTDSFTYKVSDGQVESNAAAVVITVNPPAGAPPRVETVVINDGSAQRSMVTSVTVTFNTLVTIDDLAAAFSVVNRATGQAVKLGASRTDVGGKTAVTLTFTGTGIIGGSLPDGNYLLTVYADKVHASGYDLDGNGDRTAGDDFTFGAAAVDAFFRMFGDQDGDRDVDATDRFKFFGARGKTRGEAGYLWYFDYDNDGDVDSVGMDVDQFNLRYRKTLGF